MDILYVVLNISPIERNDLELFILILVRDSEFTQKISYAYVYGFKK